MNTTTTMLASLGATAPTTVRLFRFGLNETTKGTFILTESDAKSCMDKARENGNALCFDYDHAMLGAANAIDPSMAGEAAAWFELSLGPDGLYATNIKWTRKAREQIESGARRFISPAFTHTATKHVLSIINVALTNLPATKRLEPLAASALTRDQRHVAAMLSLDPGHFAEVLASPDVRKQNLIEEQIAWCRRFGKDPAPYLATIERTFK